MSSPVLDAILSRRVTRNMTAEPVAPEQLEQVLRAARHAPSAGNRRLQPVVPVLDPALLRMLRMVSPGMHPRPQAAVVICIDVDRAVAFGFRPDTPGLFVDVGTMAATILLAAHAIGLGACPISSFSRVAVDRLLALPPGRRSQMIVCLGHPAAEQPAAMGARLRRG